MSCRVKVKDNDNAPTQSLTETLGGVAMVKDCAEARQLNRPSCRNLISLITGRHC